MKYVFIEYSLSLTGDSFPDMKYCFLFLFLFAMVPCLGQNADSLKIIVLGKSSLQKRLNAAVQALNSPSIKNAAEKRTIAKIGLALALKTNSKTAAGLLLIGIGKSFYQAGNNDSAAYYYGKAAGLLYKTDTLSNNYIELAKSFTQLKDYARAIEFYNKSISVASQSGSRRTLITTFNQLGQLYESTHNYHEALNYFRQSFEISDSLDFVTKTRENTSEAYSRNFMRDVMGSIKQQAGTEQDLLKTIATKKSLNDTLALTINYFNLGVMYKGKQQYAQALEALQQCEQYAAKIHYTDMQSSALNAMADMYEQQGNYRQSVICIKKRIALNSPANLRTSKTVDELQTKYEITQREDQVLQQQFEITKRNYWMAGIAVVVQSLLVIGLIYYKQTKLRQRNIAMQAIIATEESERKRIAQDLHDSVSQTISAAKINLTVIGGELSFASDEQRKRFNNAIKMVDDGFKEVRTISHNMMPWALNETGLARVIEQFIKNIESEAIAINFFSSGFDAPFDDATEIILYRVLQESVNNVMKHANANRIDISLIKDDGGNISLTIEDNGKGFDASNTDTYKGMGLNNLQSRVNFLKGKVELDSHPGKGTLVSVYIPFAGKTL